MTSPFLLHLGNVVPQEENAAWAGRVAKITTLKQDLGSIWQKQISRKNAIDALEQTVQILQSQQFSLASGAPVTEGQFDFTYLIPQAKLKHALEELIFASGVTIMESNHVGRNGDQSSTTAKWSFGNEPTFTSMVQSLYRVGLWGAEAAAAAAAAAAVMRLLDFLVHQLCRSAAKAKRASKPVSQVLEQIIRSHFEPMVDTLPLRGAKMTEGLDYYIFASSKLALYRSQDFFDLILSRDSDIIRADYILEDIRVCAADPTARRFLLEELTRRLREELLQPGCTTVEILDCFVRAVHRTRSIDPHGSLLNEISKTFRVYVKMRDDAVRIMLLNFLEGCKRQGDGGVAEWAEYSRGIANSVKREAELYSGEYFEGVDLRDLNWQPEPVDASYGHQAAKNMDDLGHLIKLAEQTVFVSELQSLFRSRLLGSAGSEYIQELDLLQMLKRRFDHEGAFQNVEVMLNDVLQSHRLLNEMVDEHKDRALNLSSDIDAETPLAEEKALFEIPFKAHVLSRTYWANVESIDFNLPDVMQRQMSIFEAKFRTLHDQKQLQWSKQLGHVLVELELENRNFSREVPPPMAAVIACFSTSGDDSQARDKQEWSFEELKSSLAMEESLLRQCLTYWIAQEILAETSSGTYRVVEDLSEIPSTSQAAAAEAALAADTNVLDPTSEASAGAVELKSAADLLRENGLVYSNFIAALLTNQGGMPAPRIHMILTNMMPGGFPFAIEDLVDFLREMASEGEAGKARIESAAGNWRIKKK